MIEVCITAVKGGFRELYRTPDLPLSIAREIRHDSGSGFSIGQEAYSIFFVNNGVVFSKCRIVTDGMGGRRVGNVNISLFIPNNWKLSGSDVKELLDKLLNDYCKDYAPENNLDNIYEDWSFVNTITAPYESKLLPNDDEMHSGTAEAAFLYYSDDESLKKEKVFSLQEYLDKPYQEEYSDCKQVFFVEKNLENKPENPLNALRHNPNPQADLTGKIDLENPFYILKELGAGQKGITIEVWVWSEKKDKWEVRSNDDKIKKKDKIRIRYSKHPVDRYFKSINEEGKLTDADISQYFIIDGKRLTVRKDVTLQPVPQTISFEIKDRKGNPINDVEIQFGTKTPQKVSDSDQFNYTFRGEELKDSWTISAKKDNFFGKTTFVPENQNGILVLYLQERITIPIKVVDKDTGSELHAFKISSINTNGFKETNQLEFIGEQIDTLCDITILQDGYLDKTIQIKPREDKRGVHIELKKRPKPKTYCIESKEGTKKKSCPGYSNYTDGKDVCEYIIPPKGYRFSHFVLDENDKGRRDGTLIAIYEKEKQKNKKWVKIGGSIVGGIVLAVAIILLAPHFSSDKSEQKPENIKEQIENYVAGIYLSKENLERFQREHCQIPNDTTAPAPNNRAEKSWKNFWGIFGNSREIVATTQTATLPDFCSKLEDALVIRNAINSGNIDKLRNKTFSNQQTVFGQAINNIEDEHKVQISDTLRIRANQMNLVEIAELINNVQNELRQQAQADESQRSEYEQQQLQQQLQQQQQLERERELERQLSEQFWTLVRSGNIVEAEYRHLFSRFGSISYRNAYRQFFHDHLSNPNVFRRFRDIPEIDRRRAQTLDELRRLINEQ